MKKFLKITGITIFLFLVIIIVTPYVFRDKLFELTKEEINKNLKAEVDFDFDVSIFQNFPNLTVTLDQVQIIGKEQFANDTLIHIKQIAATVDIMSVISGDSISVKGVLIDSPMINALIAKDSTANYDIVKSEEEQLEEAIDTSSSSFALKLQNIEIKNANIIYDDIPGNMYSKINGLNMTIDGDFTESSTLIQTMVTMTGLTYKMDGVTYLSNAKFDLKAGIAAEFEAEKYTLKENVMHINALELAYDGWLQFKGDDMIMDFTYNAPKTEFKNILSLVPGIFMEGFEDIKTSGKLALTGDIKGTYAETPETYPSFNLDLLIENGTFQYPDLPKAVKNINAELHVNNPASDLDSMVINLAKFNVNFAENPISMDFLMKYPMTNSYMKASMKGKIDLNTMSDFIPLDSITMQGIITPNIEFAAFMSDIDNENYDAIKALGQLGVSDFTYIDSDFPQGIFITKMNMLFSPQFVDLENCDIKIGKSDISLAGKLENFIPYALADETIVGNLDYYSHYFDANEFLGEETEEDVTTDTVSEAYEIIEVPANIDFVLQTKIDRLLYDTYDIENLIGKIIIRNSKVDLENIHMDMLGGSMVMKGYYETPAGKEAKAEFDMDIQKFDVKKSFLTFNTIQQLAPIAKYCTGTFSTKVNFNSFLQKDFMPDLSSLSGFGELETTTLSMNGSPVQNLMVNQLKQDKLKNISTEDILMFFEIKDGNVEIKPFETSLNNNKTIIEGKSGLDGGLDYKIAMQLPKDQMGAATNTALNSLSNAAGKKGIDANIGDYIDVTMLVTGTMDNPKLKPILGNTTSSVFNSVKDQAQQRLAQEKERARIEAQKKIDAEKERLQAAADKKKKELEDQAKKQVQQKTNEVKSTVKKQTTKQIKGLLGK